MCDQAQLDELTALVESADTASTICDTYNVSEIGVQQAAFKYLWMNAITTGDTATGASDGLNIMILLVSAYLVFLMQAGFAMLCAGAVRQKNALNILLKNVLDACVGGVAWYLIGFAFAFGVGSENPNAFIGNSDFALHNTISLARQGTGYEWAFFIFQWAFSASAATIVSGAVAERCAFGAYMAYTFFLSAFVYPVIVHWVWSSNGWLCAFNLDSRILGMGAIDFAGSGVVHMVGGWSALAAAAVLGPRMGRFQEGYDQNEFKGHSVTLQVLGTFLLWFGWYGFNPGSQLLFVGLNAEIAARVAVTTTLAACAGGCGALVMSQLVYRSWNLPLVCNCILAGLVGITAGCSVVEPWAAIICGLLAAPVFLGAEHLVMKLKVDDPVSAFALHGAVGAYGVLFPGFLARLDYVQQVYPEIADDSNKQGILYGGHGQILLNNFIEVVVIIAWTGGLMTIFFLALKFAGVLRVAPELEARGLDEFHNDATVHGFKSKDKSNKGDTSSKGGSVHKPTDYSEGPSTNKGSVVVDAA